MVKLEKEDREMLVHKLRQLAAEFGADLETIEALATEMVQEEKGL